MNSSADASGPPASSPLAGHATASGYMAVVAATLVQAPSNPPVPAVT